MNNSDHIYTRSRFGIDNRVWFTIGIVGFFSLGLLGYKIADNVRCTPFDILIKGYTAGKANSYYVGEEISFSTSIKSKYVEWDFGDHEKVEGNPVKHSFKKEGTFIVTATVDGKCVERKTLSIQQLSHTPATTSTTIENPITGPEVIYTGQPVNFTSATLAGAYEWTVLNTPDFPAQTADIATYTFPTPGTRILELKLDNDAAKVFRKTIQVLQPATSADNNLPDNSVQTPVIAPPVPAEENQDEKQPEKPKTTVIPNEEFVGMLNAATEGQKDIQSFSQFLCEGPQTKVLCNGTEWETMGSFHQKIYGKKRYDIKSVEVVRDENNCVKILKIKYKKRALGIF